MKKGALAKAGTERQSMTSWLAPMATLGLHLVGILAVALAVGSFVLPGAYASMMWSVGMADGAMGQSLMFNAVVHLGLSTLLWLAGVALFQALWSKRRSLQPQRRMTSRRRGSVYVEFLAVLPVFLLLTFGLLQLLFINLGGALARVAAYEAARTAWIWEPEMSVNQANPNNNVDMAQLEDRVRISAALVMTPIAPGDYRMSGDTTEQMEAMREAMTARFLPNPGVVDVAAQVSGIQQVAGSGPASLVKSLDSASMPERAYRKFTFSYLATDEVNVIIEPSRVGASFIYNQHMAMPFVNVFLGQERPGLAGRGGHYFVWDVEYTFPPQRHGANRSIPVD